MNEKILLGAITYIPETMILDAENNAAMKTALYSYKRHVRTLLLVSLFATLAFLTLTGFAIYHFFYSTPIENTNLYVYVDGMVLSDTVPAIENPETAATALAEMYLEDMMIASDERTFTITKYKNLNVHLYPTIDMDEDTATIYLLRPSEISKNTWIVEIDVMFQYQGTLSPIGSIEGQWIDILYQASPIGFLLTKDGTEYTLQSRYYTANGN